MSKTPAQKLANWQNHFIKQNMPKGLTDAAQRLYKTAVSKIAVIFPSEGGSRVSYEKLSTEELFALGIIGTRSFPMMARTPLAKGDVDCMADVREMVKAISPRGRLDEFEVIAPPDEAAKYRLLDSERKRILVTQHGQKFAPKKSKGSMSKRTQYIHKLVADNPSKTAKELLQLEGVRDAIGKMADGTFANHVTEARNPKKIVIFHGLAIP